jgi:hypothetical protein
MPIARRDSGVRALLPESCAQARLVVHTGNVSSTQAVIELIESVQYWPNDAALVVTNVGDTAYANAVRDRAARSPRSRDIALLPPLPREQMLDMQAEARVGVSLLRSEDNLESSMPAPNKVGEYLHAGLLVVGIDSPYMAMLADHGVAVLTPKLEPRAIASAITTALRDTAEPDARQRVIGVARSWYHMSHQLEPVLCYLMNGSPNAAPGMR